MPRSPNNGCRWSTPKWTALGPHLPVQLCLPEDRRRNARSQGDRRRGARGQAGDRPARIAPSPKAASSPATASPSPTSIVMPILAYLKNFPESGSAIAAAKSLSAYYDRLAARPSFQKTRRRRDGRQRGHERLHFVRRGGDSSGAMRIAPYFFCAALLSGSCASRRARRRRRLSKPGCSRCGRRRSELGVSRATFDMATRGLEPDLSLPELVIPGRPEQPRRGSRNSSRRRRII